MKLNVQVLVEIARACRGVPCSLRLCHVNGADIQAVGIANAAGSRYAKKNIMAAMMARAVAVSFAAVASSSSMVFDGSGL